MNMKFLKNMKYRDPWTIRSAENIFTDRHFTSREKADKCGRKKPLPLHGL